MFFCVMYLFSLLSFGFGVKGILVVMLLGLKSGLIWIFLMFV